MAALQPRPPHSGPRKGEVRSRLLSLFNARTFDSPPRKTASASPTPQELGLPKYRQLVVALPSPALTPKRPGTPLASAVSSRPMTPDGYFQGMTDLTSDVSKSLRASTKLKTESSIRRRSTNASNTPTTVKTETDRSRIRADIAARTKVRLNNFLCAHRELFLPLLPENNAITKLLVAAGPTSTDALVIPFRHLESQPDGIRATMKPYQLTGLSFLVHMYENGASAILGDEMGLGKTLQTLCLFQYLKIHQPLPSGQARPSLVICPLSVLSSWVSEAEKWAPGLKVMRFHGNASYRNTLKLQAHSRRATHSSNFDGPPDFVVTTYDIFAIEKNWFRSAFVWRYCVLDEGHKIKNEETEISRALQSLQAEYRLLLTGTPVQNNLQEMWALLHWLYPSVFVVQTKDAFTHSFDIGKGQVSETFMQNARRLLEILMMRRTKMSPGVNLGLPPKEEIILYLPLTATQRQVYLKVLTQADESVLQGIFSGSVEGELMDRKLDGGADQVTVGVTAGRVKQEQQQQPAFNKTAWQRLMNLVMRLRQVSIHPYLIDDAVPDPYTFDDHIRTASAKFIALDKLLTEYVLQRNEKVLVFSGFTGALDWVEDLLKLKAGFGKKTRFGFTRLDGGTCKARRNLAIRTFNDVDSHDRVMMVSTRAGGLGLNLTAATVVIFMDFDWNPQVDLQAEARAHRIGQTRPVTVYKLCTRGTVEEQMLERINKKLYLSVKITESMQDHYGTPDVLALGKRKREEIKSEFGGDSSVPDIGVSQLQSLIRRGAATVVQADQEIDMTTWTFGEMVDKCRDKTVEGEEEVVDANAEAEWLAKSARVECAVLDGVKYKRAKISNETPVELMGDRAHRRIGKNTTVLIDGYEVSKNSLGCAMWEAVPTMAGKNPLYAEPKRAKAAPILHQKRCQICSGGSNKLVDCAACPRAYHATCLSPAAQKKTGMSGLRCPQHYCADCDRNNADAGGMLYRCRTCEKSYCEDCVSFDQIRLVGETIDEFESLDYEPRTQAYYIDCASCFGGHESKSDAKKRKRDVESDSESSSGSEIEMLEPARKKIKREALTSAAVCNGTVKRGNSHPEVKRERSRSMPDIIDLDDYD